MDRERQCIMSINIKGLKLGFWDVDNFIDLFREGISGPQVQRKCGTVRGEVSIDSLPPTDINPTPRP